MLKCAGMSRPQKAFDLERLFWALADRTRLRLLNLIGDDEVCVCFLVEILGVSQPTVSRHLAYLRRAGIVATRREGKWMHYRIIPPTNLGAASVLREVCACLAREPEMQRDRKRLVEVCCAPYLPIQLQGAPRPTSFAVA